MPALVVLALLAGSGTAWAHAHLKTATPAPDSTVQTPPEAVTINFTEGVEPKFSSIEVQDADGHRIDKGTATTSPTDNKQFSVGLPPLQPGTYKVVWHATAVDTHKTEGMFQFTVKP
jgi:methionine-rich copper-binding protein CopC